MKKLISILLAVSMTLLLCSCGTPPEKMQELVDAYNELKESYENCGETLASLGVTAESELGISYAEWGDVLSGLAEDINADSGRKSEETIDVLLERIGEMKTVIDDTLEEYEQTLQALVVEGYWNLEDESGRVLCFDNGMLTVYDEQEEVLAQGRYTQDGVELSLHINGETYEGSTDGSTLVCGDGNDTFSAGFAGLIRE